MSEIVSGGSRGFELGRVFTAAFGIVRERAMAIATLVVLVAWGPQLMADWAYAPALARLGPNGLRLAVAVFPGVGVAASLVMRAAVTAVAVGASASPIGMRGAILSALRATPTLLPYWLLAASPPILGYLIRGGAIASPAIGLLPFTLFSWGVAILVAVTLGVLTPVVIAERPGVFGAAARSFSLMSGGRWKFLGLYLLIQLVAAAPRTLATLALSVSGAGLRTTGMSAMLAQALIVSLLTDVALALWAVLTAASYREFCRVHDGAAPGEVAEIFA